MRATSCCDIGGPGQPLRRARPDSRRRRSRRRCCSTSRARRHARRHRRRRRVPSNLQRQVVTTPDLGMAKSTARPPSSETQSARRGRTASSASARTRLICSAATISSPTARQFRDPLSRVRRLLFHEEAAYYRRTRRLDGTLTTIRSTRRAPTASQPTYLSVSQPPPPGTIAAAPKPAFWRAYWRHRLDSGAGGDREIVGFGEGSRPPYHARCERQRFETCARLGHGQSAHRHKADHQGFVDSRLVAVALHADRKF